MIFELLLERTSQEQRLSCNHQYPLSAVVFRSVQAVDEKFSQWLHQEGVKLDTGKSFKLFSFSNLILPYGQWKQEGDRLRLLGDEASLKMGFCLPEVAQKFMKGVWRQGMEIEVADRKSAVTFRVKQVKPLKLELPEGKVKVKALSPLVIRKKVFDVREKRVKNQCISPKDPDFEFLFFQGLYDKYKASCQFLGQEAKAFDLDKMRFKLLSKPYSKRVELKQGAFVYGNKFSFELDAPKELVELGLTAGFGALSSQGFGFCELMSNN